MDSESAERWEIDQDDFGNPVVRHRHRTATVPAYVSKNADGRRSARCPQCGEQFAVPEKPS
ncbi:MAG TPA: hypothetical protein VFH90_05440 [Candidatus Limnocylindria bacterium]|nr:hypothetical protein [Candidatus Limnocylindria bacterium]